MRFWDGVGHKHRIWALDPNPLFWTRRLSENPCFYTFTKPSIFILYFFYTFLYFFILSQWFCLAFVKNVGFLVAFYTFSY